MICGRQADDVASASAPPQGHPLAERMGQAWNFAAMCSGRLQAVSLKLSASLLNCKAQLCRCQLNCVIVKVQVHQLKKVRRNEVIEIGNLSSWFAFLPSPACRMEREKGLARQGHVISVSVMSTEPSIEN